MPFGFNALLGIFVPKPADDDPSAECIRPASGLRPLGLKNTDNKLITSVVFRRLSLALPHNLCDIQRGFVMGRNFGQNVVEIDGFARLYSADPSAASLKPALVSYDFGAAFP
eukprot:1114241-Pyramimonas_sp.AAC.1